MILAIILLILIILIVSILLLFLFYILFPSIKNNQSDVKEDPVISDDEKNYIRPIKEEFVPTKHKAVVLCACDKEFECRRENFNKEHSCFMINSINESGTDCKFACIGLGDCAKVCPQQAIIIKNRTAVVSSLCIGCGKCVNVCPKHIIRMVPQDTKTIIQCSSDLDSITTCNKNHFEKNLEWNDKKYFKIWSYCYKLFKHIIEK